jgi:ADP-ribosylation factor-like protein 5B
MTEEEIINHLNLAEIREHDWHI